MMPQEMEWRQRVQAGQEPATMHYEFLRNAYNYHLMLFLMNYPVCHITTFDECCYHAVMGEADAKRALYNLAGGLQ